MTVGVTVSFNYEDQRWTHEFDVEPGTTIMKLKEKMIAPKGTKQDADGFELRLRGQRVSDVEKINQAVTLDFEYLGAEEGSKRAKEDEIDRMRREKEKDDALAKPKPKPQQVPKPVAPAPSNPPSGNLAINVIVDAELDFKSEVKVSRGSTIHDVKVKLAAMDPTGSTKPETFGLALVKVGSPAKSLPDSTVLTDAHLELQVSDPYVGPSKPVEITSQVLAVLPGVPIWKVTGGADKGGILVRKGLQTTSPQLSDRLATGAIVEQVELAGERLHYKTISGAGPAVGWVSLTVGGKELLKKIEAGTPESFPLDRAVAMQKDLLIQFLKPDFQEQLNALIDEIPTKTGGDFMVRRNALLFAAQREVIVKYGFEGSPKGITKMMNAFTPHLHSALINANTAEIDAALQLNQ